MCWVLLLVLDAHVLLGCDGSPARSEMSKKAGHRQQCCLDGAMPPCIWYVYIDPGAGARCSCCDAQEGDSVIIDVDADGQVSVLNGDKKMTQMLSETPAGIS